MWDMATKMDNMLRAFENGTEVTEDRLGDYSRVRFHNGQWIRDTRKFYV